jgi:hypothetical protein
MVVPRPEVLQECRFILLLFVLLAGPSLETVAHGASASQDADETASPFEVIERLGGLVTALVADGDHLYLGVGARLVILDTDTPSGVPEGGSDSVGLPHTISDAALLFPGLVAVLAEDAVYFVDVADPEAARVIDSYIPRTPLRALEARQGICFLLGDESVYVVDASAPSNTHQVAAIDLPVPAKSNTKLVVGDGVLFVGGGIGSLLVYDVGRPDTPLLIGGAEDVHDIEKMAASGRTLYVTDSADRFDNEGNRVVGVVAYVLEVVGDNQLVKHGFVDLVPPTPVPGEFMAVDMAADGSNLYISGSEVGPSGMPEFRQIRCWDLSVPARPIEVSRVDVADLGGTVRMVISGGRVYLASNDVRPSTGGYQSPAIGAADISEPSAMSWLGFWQRDVLGRAQIVAASQRDVVIKEYAGLTHVFEGPYGVGARRAGYIDAEAASGIVEMQLDSDRLFTLEPGELALFDLTNREHPTLLAQAIARTSLPVMAVSEPYVFATKCRQYDPVDGEEGCSITAFEVTPGDPTSMRQVSVLPVGRHVRGIALSGLFAYAVVADDVSSRPERLSSYDFSDPTQPTFVADVELDEGAKPKRIAVRDELAYVAAYTEATRNGPAVNSLHILDVSDPPRSRVVGSFVTSTASSDRKYGFTTQHYPIAVMDEHVLFAGNEAVVHVVDVQDPRHPVEVQRLEVEDVVTDLDAAARHAYVVMKNGGMMTLKATYPAPEPNVGHAAFLPLAVTSDGGIR